MALPYLVTYLPLGRRRGNGPCRVGFLIVGLVFFGCGALFGVGLVKGCTLGSVLGACCGGVGDCWVGGVGTLGSLAGAIVGAGDGNGGGLVVARRSICAIWMYALVMLDPKVSVGILVLSVCWSKTNMSSAVWRR